jgi:hypothetical protein
MPPGIPASHLPACIGEWSADMAKKKKPAAAASASTPKVRVRMYRQGLGDCFLITLNLGAAEKHILIDCGTLGATTTGVKIAKVVQNIKDITKDHLHLLVATHEHWDHVSGFGSSQEEFSAMTIDNVWMAWTEDPSDPDAKKLQKTKGDLGAALKAAVHALAKGPGDAPAIGQNVASILGFFDDESLGASKFSESVDKAMDFVRTKLGVKARYLDPAKHKVIEDAWLAGFRVYVLGPPRDETAMNNLGEHGSSELYSLAQGLKAAAEFRASGQSVGTYLDGCSADGRSQFSDGLPFDIRYRHDASLPSTKQMFKKTYFADADGWRRVDHDWLHLASDLALQLDSATNNTSLALAIERIADGKVLLFPADAQQGNWLSWHDSGMKWSVEDGGVTRTITATDLLARTVFYKVGHHSSHNATAKGKGLELMTHEDLTAFIPVDRAVALNRNPKDKWQMPARPLYRRLLEQCGGRVARSDIGWAADPTKAANKQAEKKFEDMATKAEWTKWKTAQDKTSVTVDPLFIDYVLG